MSFGWRLDSQLVCLLVVMQCVWQQLYRAEVWSCLLLLRREAWGPVLFRWMEIPVWQSWRTQEEAFIFTIKVARPLRLTRRRRWCVSLWLCDNIAQYSVSSTKYRCQAEDTCQLLSYVNHERGMHVGLQKRYPHSHD
jgi:hypothetical protein